MNLWNPSSKLGTLFLSWFLNTKPIIKLFSDNFNKPDSHYINILRKKSNFIKIEKNILFLKCKNILEKISDIQGLNVDKKSKRYYPYNSLACQTLGYVDLDGIGQGGIEGNFNTILSGDTSKIKLKKWFKISIT